MSDQDKLIVDELRARLAEALQAQSAAEKERDKYRMSEAWAVKLLERCHDRADLGCGDEMLADDVARYLGTPSPKAPA